MAKTRTKALACALAVCMTAGIAGAAYSGLTEPVSANALDTSSTVTYPFATGDSAFNNAMILKAGQGTGYEQFEILLDSVTDFTDVKYIAVQMSVNDLGAAGKIWCVFGFFSENMGGVAYWDVNDRTTNVYFQSESGSFTTVTNYECEFNSTMTGTLWIPIEAVSKRSWDAADESNMDKTKIKSLYGLFYAPTYYDWEIAFGNISVYRGEPDVVSQELVVNCTQSERRTAGQHYYLGGSPDVSVSWLSDSQLPKIPYAFEEDFFTNSVTWTAASGATLTAGFEESDFSDKTHLLVQYYSQDAVRLQYALSDGTNTTALQSGARTFFIAKGANFGNITNTTASNGVTVTGGNGRWLMGMIVIPIEESMSGNASLSAITNLVITAAGSGKVVFGGIAAYKGIRGDGTYEGGTTFEVLAQSSEILSHYTASNDTVVLTDGNPMTDRGVYTQDITFGSKTYDEEYSSDKNTGFFFTGGAYGTAVSTTDSYGDPALKITATGTAGDGYLAIAGSLATGVTWAGAEGMVLWARNDSTSEVYFSPEINCTSVGLSGGSYQVLSDRFNVKQGTRFYLYDVNTGRTSIYMTRPTITLPVGFEGWVFVPFSAFARASWSTNGVTEFMGENSYVSFIGFSVVAAENIGKSFSINKIGAYYKTPQLETAFVNAGENSISAILGLDD